MKGIIQAYALFVVLMGIALGFMLYVRVDSIQYMSRLILNQSLHETMVMLEPLSFAEREERVNEIINKNIRLRDAEGIVDSIKVVGYHLNPLALRVKLIVKSYGNDWVFDETMIEVEP